MKDIHVDAKKWPQKVLNGHFSNLNFQIFFFQNWKTQFWKQIAIYVIAFDPIKIQTCLAPQNDCQNPSFVKDNYVQGVIAISGKTFKLIFWKNHWLYWNKRYTSRKPLILALIWHPESGCGIIMRLPRPHRRQEVKNPPRGPMLFAARRRDALLMMPRPLSRCQIKAEIKGFLLIYGLFLY